jgi:hypothetical protein
MSKHIEVEGGEIAIQNEAGDIAIVPIKDVEKVKGMMNDPKAIDDYVSKLPKMADYAEDGSLVYQMWEEKTGTPWKTAHSQGLTTGSYDDNMKLRKDLLAGKYDKNVSAAAQPTKTDISFSEAFSKARQEQGAEGKFEWNGKMYGTKYKSEVEPKKKDTSAYAEKVRNSRQGTRKNKDGSESTVLMTSSDNYAYPTLFQDKDGKWVELNDKDNWAARKEAEKRGELYEFNSPGEAALFAEGAWKKGTSQNTFKSPGGAGGSAQAGANKGQQDLTGLLGNALKGSVNLPEGKKIEDEPWYGNVVNSFNEDLENFKTGLDTIKEGVDNINNINDNVSNTITSWVDKLAMEHIPGYKADSFEAEEEEVITEKFVPSEVPLGTKSSFKNTFGEAQKYKGSTVNPKTGKRYYSRTKYPIHSFSNSFDNDKGYDYLPLPNRGNQSDKTYNTPGVAHFLLDSDISGEDKYAHPYSQRYIEKQLKGKNITPGSTVQDQYFPVYQKKGDRVNIKYKTRSELLNENSNQISNKPWVSSKPVLGVDNSYKKNEEDERIKTATYKIAAPLRQYKFSDLDWEGTPEVHDGFNGSVYSIPTKEKFINSKDKPSKQSHLIHDGNKNSYGDYSGTTVVFIINKNGHRYIEDYSNSIGNIERRAKSLMNMYDISEDELVIGMHDIGSFNAKPASKNGKLKYNTEKFNPKKETGAALAF